MGSPRLYQVFYNPPPQTSSLWGPWSQCLPYFSWAHSKMSNFWVSLSLLFLGVSTIWVLIFNIELTSGYWIYCTIFVCRTRSNTASSTSVIFFILSPVFSVLAYPSVFWMLGAILSKHFDVRCPDRVIKHTSDSEEKKTTFPRRLRHFLIFS